MSGNPERTHTYHAKAHIVSGQIRLPINRGIYHQEQATLASEEPGYFSQHSLGHNEEGVLSFRRAYTQVGGHKDTKPGHGWTTLSTSVIEDFNLLEVVTADRVVAQVSTEHPAEGYIPTVTFLGTRFDNLRIDGQPVKCEMDRLILGPKPDNDASYHSHPHFRQRVEAQYQRISSQGNVPDEIARRYNQFPATPEEPIECSLVNHVEGDFPGRCFGHVIDIPHFGKVYLATLRIEHADPHPEKKTPQTMTISLTMIEARMGCLAEGEVRAASNVVNGQTFP